MENSVSFFSPWIKPESRGGSCSNSRIRGSTLSTIAAGRKFSVRAEITPARKRLAPRSETFILGKCASGRGCFLAMVLTRPQGTNWKNVLSNTVSWQQDVRNERLPRGFVPSIRHERPRGQSAERPERSWVIPLPIRRVPFHSSFRSGEWRVPGRSQRQCDSYRREIPYRQSCARYADHRRGGWTCPGYSRIQGRLPRAARRRNGDTRPDRRRLWAGRAVFESYSYAQCRPRLPD